MELTTREELEILRSRIEDYLSQACILCREVYGFGGNLENDRSDLALIKKMFHRNLLDYEAKCKTEPQLKFSTPDWFRFSSSNLREIINRYKLPKPNKVEAILD